MKKGIKMSIGLFSPFFEATEFCLSLPNGNCCSEMKTFFTPGKNQKSDFVPPPLTSLKISLLQICLSRSVNLIQGKKNITLWDLSQWTMDAMSESLTI